MKTLRVVLAAGMAALSAMAMGEAVDVNGNPVVPETDLGDIDTDATTVGDLRDVMTPGYAAVSNAAMNAATAAQMAAKQDKLPYSTNAIPQGAVSGLSTALGGKVSKSGDTMTGDLIIEKANPRLRISTGMYDLGMKITNGQKYLETEDYDYLLPNKDGTIALTKDIPDVSKKQDKLPYPTNAIPYAAISGKPTNISAFNNDVGYVTEAVVGAAATAATNYTDIAAMKPKAFVISPNADYYYSGTASIPAGNYFRTVSGSGNMFYSANIPMPSGKFTVTGNLDDDPIVAAYGGEVTIAPHKVSVSYLGGYERDGRYSIADVVFSPTSEDYELSSVDLRLSIQMHMNIISSSPSDIYANFSFPSYYTYITTEDGKQHYLYNMTRVNDTTFSYTDDVYDPSAGTSSTYSRTVSFAFVQDKAVDWGFAFFEGAEIATKGDPGTVKTLGVRTGLEGEYGSGYGYKTYDFATDRRNWELHVPGLVATYSRNTGTRYVTFADPYTGDTMAGYIYASPLSFSECGIVGADLEETADTYGYDGCASAMWRVWMFPANTNNTDYCTLAVAATNRVTNGITGVGPLDEPAAPSVATSYYSWRTTYGYDRTTAHNMSNFRILSITGSGATRTITFCYDVLAYITQQSLTRYKYSYSVTNTVSLSSSLSVNATYVKPSTLIITDKTHHFIYDDGLLCTWELKATNGVFYVEKISDSDYRKVEVR